MEMVNLAKINQFNDNIFLLPLPYSRLNNLPSWGGRYRTSAEISPQSERGLRSVGQRKW